MPEDVDPAVGYSEQPVEPESSETPFAYLGLDDDEGEAAPDAPLAEAPEAEVAAAAPAVEEAAPAEPVAEAPAYQPQPPPEFPFTAEEWRAMVEVEDGTDAEARLKQQVLIHQRTARHEYQAQTAQRAQRTAMGINDAFYNRFGAEFDEASQSLQPHMRGTKEGVALAAAAAVSAHAARSGNIATAFAEAAQLLQGAPAKPAPAPSTAPTAPVVRLTTPSASPQRQVVTAGRGNNRGLDAVSALFGVDKNDIPQGGGRG